MEKLDPRATALVLVDLQKGILPFAKGPHSAEAVLASAGALARRFRALGAPVVRVRLAWSPGYADALHQPVDRPSPLPPGGLPADWDEPAPELEPAPSDILVTKRQWGAFHGTDLDLQMRRRGISTLVLAGIATPIGVESTARAAWEHGYALVLAEDAMSAPDPAHHRHSVEVILPRLGRVRATAQVLEMLA